MCQTSDLSSCKRARVHLPRLFWNPANQDLLLIAASERESRSAFVPTQWNQTEWKPWTGCKDKGGFTWDGPSRNFVPLVWMDWRSRRWARGARGLTSSPLLWMRMCNLAPLFGSSRDCQEPQTEPITCPTVMYAGEGPHAVPWTAPPSPQTSIQRHLWHRQVRR